MDQNNIMSLVALIVAVVGGIIGVINHKKIRSKCNDKVLEASIDITNTSPEVKKDENKNIIV
jgi:predicted negative regulator of RcsB-dependent stress response